MLSTHMCNANVQWTAEWIVGGHSMLELELRREFQDHCVHVEVMTASKAMRLDAVTEQGG